MLYGTEYGQTAWTPPGKRAYVNGTELHFTLCFEI